MGLRRIIESSHETYLFIYFLVSILAQKFDFFFLI